MPTITKLNEYSLGIALPKKQMTYSQINPLKSGGFSRKPFNLNHLYLI